MLYTEKDLSEPISPHDIKEWQMFEYKYTQLGKTDEADKEICELHLRIPGRYDNTIETLRYIAEDNSWLHDSILLTLSYLSQDTFRILKGKQIRFGIQDGVMGFRILNAEKGK